MYCPNCGKENSAEQKFCRACGLSLEKAIQSLAEQLPERELDKNLRERQERIDRLITIVGGSAVAIVLAGVFWGIIYGIMIVKGQVIPGLLMLAFIIGMVIAGLLTLYRDSLNKAAGKRRSSQPALPEARTAELEAHLEPVPSVTERTTELLTTDKRDADS